MSPTRVGSGVTPAERGAPGRRSSSTIGAWYELSKRSATPSTSASPRAAARSATMTANGWSGRRLRSRRRVSTASSVASATRWYPPMPLTARICPSSRRPAGVGAPVPADRRYLGEPHVLHQGAGRWRIPHIAHELRDGGGRALYLNGDDAGLVAYRTGQPVPGGEPVHEWPEPNTLDKTGDD